MTVAGLSLSMASALVSRSRWLKPIGLFVDAGKWTRREIAVGLINQLKPRQPPALARRRGRGGRGSDPYSAFSGSCSVPCPARSGPAGRRFSATSPEDALRQRPELASVARTASTGLPSSGDRNPESARRHRRSRLRHRCRHCAGVGRFAEPAHDEVLSRWAARAGGHVLSVGPEVSR